MKLWILGFVTFFSLSTLFSKVEAGFLVEPYLGYATSTQELATKSAFGNSEDDDDNNGGIIGGRLGYSFLLVSGGIDYGIFTSGEDKITNTSIFVGVDLPILFRFWYEHTLKSDIDVEDATIDLDFVSGNSFGVGFTGLPFVSLNLELEQLKYDAESGSGLGKVEIETDVTNIILTASLPLDF